MDIGGAVKALKEGRMVTRALWKTYGGTRFLIMCTPDDMKLFSLTTGPLYWLEREPSLFLAPFIALKNTDGTFVPAVFSQLDLLADDYEIHIDL